MKKTLAALALAGSLALIGTAPAVAAGYPILPPAATITTDGPVTPGEPFTFSGQGMDANEFVTITVTPVGAPQASGANAAGSLSAAAKINVVLAPQTLKVQADSQGRFTAQIVINETGTYAISARGDSSGTVVGPITVTVVAAELANTGGGNSSGAPLANTGADSGLILWTLVGAGALAAGAASVVVVRRRAKTEVAA